MKITKNDILFVCSLIFALWFAVVGIFWVYWIALFIAYPIGGLSILLLKMMKEHSVRTNIIKIILLIGLVLSLGMLGYLLIFER